MEKKKKKVLLKKKKSLTVIGYVTIRSGTRNQSQTLTIKGKRKGVERAQQASEHSITFNAQFRV